MKSMIYGIFLLPENRRRKQIGSKPRPAHAFPPPWPIWKRPGKQNAPAGFLLDLAAAVPELGLIRFGFAHMRTPRPQRRKLLHTKDEHDFPRGQDRCAKCGMQRSVWDDTHAPCPRQPYTVNAMRPIT
jgi:hypothetical protein